MAHPYADKNRGRERAKAFTKQSGGSVTAPAKEPLKIEPGPIEKLGVKTYRREVGRDPATKRFGPYPYGDK